MSQGGLRRLSLFKFLKVEDLTEKERSIISPKVIPLVQARYLILEAVPKMLQGLMEKPQASRPAESLAVSVDASRMIDLHAHDAHDALHDDHMHKHAPPWTGMNPDAQVNPLGVSPTLMRGRMAPGSAPTERLPQWAMCANCSRQDSTVMSCRVGSLEVMMLCQSCNHMV